jgi:hypothetical protein
VPAARAPAIPAAAPVAAAAEPKEPAPEEQAETAVDAARAALGATADDEGNGDAPLFSPEAIHMARIELAKEALVEDNALKQRIDLEEELQRELDARERPQESHGRQRGARR